MIFDAVIVQTIEGMGILSPEESFNVFFSKGYVLEECGSGKELFKTPNFLHIQPASENLIPCLWFSASLFWRMRFSILYLA